MPVVDRRRILQAGIYEDSAAGCIAAEAVLQRYSPSGEFQALSNGVRIAHWSENHFAGTAGFLLYLLAKTTHMEQA